MRSPTASTSSYTPSPSDERPGEEVQTRGLYSQPQAQTSVIGHTKIESIHGGSAFFLHRHNYAAPHAQKFRKMTKHLRITSLHTFHSHSSHSGYASNCVMMVPVRCPLGGYQRVSMTPVASRVVPRAPTRQTRDFMMSLMSSVLIFEDYLIVVSDLPTSASRFGLTHQSSCFCLEKEVAVRRSYYLMLL